MKLFTGITLMLLISSITGTVTRKSPEEIEKSREWFRNNDSCALRSFKGDIGSLVLNSTFAGVHTGIALYQLCLQDHQSESQDSLQSDLRGVSPIGFIAAIYHGTLAYNSATKICSQYKKILHKQYPILKNSQDY